MSNIEILNSRLKHIVNYIQFEDLLSTMRRVNPNLQCNTRFRGKLIQNIAYEGNNTVSYDVIGAGNKRLCAINRLYKYIKIQEGI